MPKTCPDHGPDMPQTYHPHITPDVTPISPRMSPPYHPPWWWWRCWYEKAPGALQFNQAGEPEQPMRKKLCSVWHMGENTLPWFLVILFLVFLGWESQPSIWYMGENTLPPLWQCSFFYTFTTLFLRFLGPFLWHFLWHFLGPFFGTLFTFFGTLFLGPWCELLISLSLYLLYRVLH